MAKKLLVYFSNERSSAFEPDRVVFWWKDGYFLYADNHGTEEMCLDMLRNGAALVNWDNVSYIRCADVEDEE